MANETLPLTFEDYRKLDVGALEVGWRNAENYLSNDPQGAMEYLEGQKLVGQAAVVSELESSGEIVDKGK